MDRGSRIRKAGLTRCDMSLFVCRALQRPDCIAHHDAEVAIAGFDTQVLFSNIAGNWCSPSLKKASPVTLSEFLQSEQILIE